MRISVRFAAVGVVCAAAATIIGGALLLTTNRVAQELQKNGIAAEIVGATSSLRYLTLEYAFLPSERGRMQWNLRYASIAEKLSSTRFDPGEEQESFERVRTAHLDVAPVFLELGRAQAIQPANDSQRNNVAELVRRLTASLAHKEQVMVDGALRLQEISRERVARAQRSAVLVVFALAAALLLLVAPTMLLAFRSITLPLARVRKGAEIVGAGNLDHVIGLQTRNEIGDLARTFDQMTAKLKETTVSRDRIAQSEERTRLILETALDAVVSINGAGAITGWNSQAENTFGWTRAEALGQMLSSLIVPPLHRPAHQRGMQRYLDTGIAVMLNRRVELTAIHRDGHEFPIDLAITPIRAGAEVSFTAFARDITERKLAEARQQAQLARLQLLHQITIAIGERQDLQSIYQVAIRSIEDGLPVDFCCICSYDPLEHALTVIRVGARSNALALTLAMSEKTRIDADQNGLARCVRGELVYEANIDRIAVPFIAHLARGGLRSLVLAPLQSESRVFGVLLAARFEAQSFSSGDCEFLLHLSSHVALAARQAELHGALQQAYDDLRQSQQTVLQQERLRALGQMASGIAHDINNAISPVALYTENLLEREPNLSERARGYLKTIAQAVDDVAATVARMREFYRQREPQITLAPVQLNPLVQQVVELTRARWSDMAQQRGAVIELALVAEPDLPQVMAIDSEVREALINLIFNAVDAMPEGGTLTLRTRSTSHGSSRAPGSTGSVIVEVTDTGVGMDEDTRRHCLEPFFTTKGERGTGLGLAMVYGIAQRLGADVAIDSALGQGTTVGLVFPVLVDGPAASIAAPPPAPSARLRILVVDDDPLILKSLCESLEFDGHKTVAANGGQAGIDTFVAAASGDTAFDLVITDLGMPYVDGRKVASAVKEAADSTPVILLTGWGQRLLADAEVPPHVDRVLSKPPKLGEVRATLAELTHRSRAEVGG